MLGVMGGAVNVEEVFDRLRMEVHSSVDITELSPDVHINTPLEIIVSKHHFVRSLGPFSILNATCHKTFTIKLPIII